MEKVVMRYRRLARNVVLSTVGAALLGACEDAAPNISGLDPVLIRDVEVIPRTDTIFVADSLASAASLQLVAVITMKSGGTHTSVPVAGARSTVRVVWESSDTSVVVVDSSGVARPRGFGTATVTASAGRRASAQITVAPAAARIDVTPATAQVIEGDSIRLTAAAFDQGGRRVSGVRFNWATTGAAATVDSTGLLRTAGAGTVRVVVTTSGGVDTAVVTVLPRIFLSRASGAEGTVSTQGSGGISAGGDFSCGRITLDRAYCWGIDSSRQVGAAVQDTACVNEFEIADSTGMRRLYRCALIPTRVAGPAAFSQMSAGGAHACGITPAGAAYCWGSASWGQVGAGRGGVGVTHERPAPVSAGVRFAAISAGYGHTCALEPSGRAWCWGNDDLGQLGDEKRASSTTPIPVSPERSAQTFRQISAGLTHTCALDAAGQAFCWGNNATGELGTGARSARSEVPVAVTGGLTFAQISAGGTITPVPNATGGADTVLVGVTCGVTTGGDAYCWGANTAGQLGNGTTGLANATPTRVAGTGYTAISVGGTHVCAIQAAQAVCWGTYNLERLGPVLIGTSPVRIDTRGLQVASISSGRRHSCAVSTTGQGFCWGSNVLGPFGDGLQALLRRGWDVPVIVPR